MNDYLVWWLNEEDYYGFEPCQDVNPLKIPDYVWEQFGDRYGRSGRGRLWVDENIPVKCLPVSVNDPKWEDYKHAGGIVIKKEDAKSCLLWGGRVTTLTLDLYIPD